MEKDRRGGEETRGEREGGKENGAMQKDTGAPTRVMCTSRGREKGSG